MAIERQCATAKTEGGRSDDGTGGGEGKEEASTSTRETMEAHRTGWWRWGAAEEAQRREPKATRRVRRGDGATRRGSLSGWWGKEEGGKAMLQ